MSVFDRIGQTLGGGSTSGSGESALLQGVLDMLGQSGPGGLTGLVKAFHAQGLGEIVSSWVGMGQNLPISAGQIERGLGLEQLQQLAANADLPLEAASTALASLLPGVIDKLTPGGTVPEGGLPEQSLGFLKRKLL